MWISAIKNCLNRPVVSIALILALLHTVMASLRIASVLSSLDQGQSVISVGLLTASFALPSLLFGQAVGRIADRVPYVALIKFCCIGSVTGCLAQLLDDLSIAIVGNILVGMSANVTIIASQRELGAAVAHHERFAAFSTLSLAGPTAGFTGPVVAAFSVRLLGTSHASLCFCLLSTLAFFVVLHYEGRSHETEKTVASPHRSPTDTPSVEEKMRWHPLLLFAMASNLLVSIYVDSIRIFVLIFAYRVGGEWLVGATFSLMAALVFVTRLIGKSWLEKVPSQLLLGISLITLSLAQGLFPLLDSSQLFLVLAVTTGLAVGIVQPCVLNIIAFLSPQGLVGEVAGIRVASMSFSSLVIPILASACVSADLAWLFCLFACALGLIIAGLGIFKIPRLNRPGF